MTRRTAGAILLSAVAARAGEPVSDEPVSADTILNQAEAEASRSHRIIFADFSASW